MAPQGKQRQDGGADGNQNRPMSFNSGVPNRLLVAWGPTVNEKASDLARSSACRYAVASNAKQACVDCPEAGSVCSQFVQTV